MILRQLEAFQAVIEQGTFSAAAASLRVSQPTVSKLIQALERALGYKLFQRTGSQVVPTPRALALYHEVHRAWRGFERLSATAQALRAPVVGRLVVGADPTLSLGFVPRLLAELMAAQPGIDVTLECENGRILAEALAAGTIDIGFVSRPVHSPPHTGAIAGQPLVSGEMVCVLPPAHRLAAAAVIGPDVLQDEPLVGLLSAAEARRTIDLTFSGVAGRPRLVGEATTGLGACMVVAEGMGLALVPDLSAAAAVLAGAAIAVRPFRPVVPYTVEYALSKAAQEPGAPSLLARLALERSAAVHDAILRRALGDAGRATMSLATTRAPHAIAAD